MCRHPQDGEMEKGRMELGEGMEQSHNPPVIELLEAGSCVTEAETGKHGF